MNIQLMGCINFFQIKRHEQNDGRKENSHEKNATTQFPIDWNASWAVHLRGPIEYDFHFSMKIREKEILFANGFPAQNEKESVTTSTSRWFRAWKTLLRIRGDARRRKGFFLQTRFSSLSCHRFGIGIRGPRRNVWKESLWFVTRRACFRNEHQILEWC